MKKLVSLLNAYAARKDAPGIDEMPFANTKIEKNLEVNLQIIKKMLGESNDIIIPDDWNITCEVAELLDRALERRRLISYGGELAKVRRQLKLEDEETGDLVHIEDDSPTEEDFKIVNYFWFSGVRDYYGI